ncbi:sporulation integral membrane protein YlbJ [Catenibacillus scindens]|uniref:Sporulation integral membrane protein YlbJ n=1 Tax=Catenibacillus scindens TaxID=673271 RepID=A0A7W8M5I9_9FIRM|nr:nucleoside recognition domain-containing protein [Catenibacillus scindens]MBB5264969.1 sporulation integral membrane protein YlbJ [Catenibacillus scindens]
MKKYLLPVIFFLILLITLPSICAQGARFGLTLWFNTIIPTLFPFILMTNLLRDLHGIDFLERIFAPIITRLFKTDKSGAYPVVLGFLCGYPMGAKAVSDSYSLGRISQRQALYLLTFVNNPSPVYMISYVADFTLNSSRLALWIVAVSLISSLVAARLIHPFFTRTLPWERKPRKAQSLTLKAQSADHLPDQNAHVQKNDTASGNLLDTSIVSACELLVKIGGYMILFSILSQCIAAIPGISPLAAGLIAGLLEQTTGLGLLQQMRLPLEIKTVLAMGFICFGGLSILAQTSSVIHRQGLSVKYCILGKILTAFLAMALMTAVLTFTG